MKKNILLIVLLLCGMYNVYAQQTKTFKAFGVDDTPVYGLGGTSTNYFKFGPEYDLNKCTLVLRLEPSQALNLGASFVSVLVGDKPLASYKLSQDTGKIFIPLNSSNFDKETGYLKLQIKTTLNISDDKCRDLENPALWLKIKEDSYFIITKKNSFNLNSINLSNTLESKRAIVYPTNPTESELMAASWIYAYLRKTTLKEISVYNFGNMPDSLKNFVVVGNRANLPIALSKKINIKNQPNEGVLFLDKKLDTLITYDAKSKNKRIISTSFDKKEILFITADNDQGIMKAISAMLNPNITKSSFGNSLLVKDAIDPKFFYRSAAENTRVSLKQIGGIHTFLQGIGSLKTTYNFKTTDFTFTPEDLEINFSGLYSALKPGDRGFFNIYLNGILIKSTKLDESGGLGVSVIVNKQQLRKYNSMVTEFMFYPGQSVCKNGFLNFFADVDVDRSFIASRRSANNDVLSFYEFPSVFQRSPVEIVVSKETFGTSAKAIGELIYQLNNNTIESDNYPQIKSSAGFDANKLNENNIIAFLTQTDPLIKTVRLMPVNFNEGFKIYNSYDNKLLFQLKDNVSTGIAQIFYGRNKNALLIFTGSGPSPAEGLYNVAKNLNNQLTVLQSNVGVADSVNHYLFNVTALKDSQASETVRNFLERAWSKYSLLILGLLLLLTFGAFMFIRSKVAESKHNFDEVNNE